MTDRQMNYRINLGGNITQQATRISNSISTMSKRSLRSLTEMRVGVKEMGASIDAIGKKTEASAKYAALGAGAFAAWQTKKAIQESAQLDKSLGQLKRTAGATTKETADFRKELIDMSEATGKSVEVLNEGAQTLVASGLNFDQMRASMQPINDTMAVSEANATQLADALNAASSAFGFDLSNPKMTTEILDKMYVSGKAGRAEIQDLSGIFARVGPNAASANMSFEDTLAFIETLGQSGVPIGQLDTLADSTLRLFTNMNYLKNAQKATKVSFYDSKGEKRAAQDVLNDISAKYKKLKTDKERDKFVQKAFGQTDLDTIRGLKVLLSGNSLSQWKDIKDQISQASGAVKNDLGDALSNSIDQTDRLKNTFRSALDEIAKPINSKISDTIKTTLDEKKFSGEELLVGGGMAVAGGLAATLLGGKAMRGVGGKLGGLAAGVATGKALEAAGGATPVFVVNMPSGGVAPGAAVVDAAEAAASTAGKVGKLGKFGKFAGGAGMVMGAGMAGWEVGSAIHENIAGSKIDDAIGSVIARMAATLGNKDAQESLDRQRRFDESQQKDNQKIEMKLHVTAEGQVQVQSANASAGTQLDVGNTTRGAY